MKIGDTSGFGFTLGFSLLNSITFVYDVLTLPVYVVLNNPIGRLKKAKRKRAAPIAENDTSITYATLKKPTKYQEELLRENIDTMAKVFTHCSKKFGDKPCLGTREILKEVDEVQPNGKVFKKYSMGNYKWRSFNDVEKESISFGKGLREIGVHPGDAVVIFAETRAEWMVAAHALFKQKCILVTIYATLGDEAIVHAINETEATTVITSADLLPKFKTLLEKTPKVQAIVFMDEQHKKFENPEKIAPSVKIITYDDVVEKGSQSSVVTISPTPDDTAIIMYTSGSTGVPKGVLLSHKNLIATLIGFSDADIHENAIMMGFLPLAHVFELLVENIVIFMGFRIGYSSPLTMLDSSSKILKGSKGDATVLKPTFITSVPLIMDRIAAGIQDKVAKANYLVRLLFNFGYQYKNRWTKRGFSTPIVDRLVFGQVKRIVGGNLKLIIAGGAPLTPETHEFIKTTLCTSLLQGYGLTESTSSTSVQDIYDTTYGRVGPPLSGIHVRLVNWEEGNCTVKDKPYPRGEIVLGGDNISDGYYKMPQKTGEDFFTEGTRRWFKTGDIGEIHDDGVLKIIDRKKDLVKLQLGEYLSLGKVEAALKNSPLVDNVCVYGDSRENHCVALIVPHRENLEALLTDNGVKNKSFEEICDDENVTRTVLQYIQDYARSVKLQKFEIPSTITLVKEIWAPETGFVTTTFKLKRKDIQTYYRDAIERMYSSDAIRL